MSSVGQLVEHIASVTMQDLRSQHSLEMFFNAAHPANILHCVEQLNGQTDVIGQIIDQAGVHVDDVVPNPLPAASAAKVLANRRLELQAMELAGEIGQLVVRAAADGEKSITNVPLKSLPSWRSSIAPSKFFSQAHRRYAWQGEQNWEYSLPQKAASSAPLQLLRRVFEAKGFRVELGLVEQGWSGDWSEEYAPIADPAHPEISFRELPICVSLRWGDDDEYELDELDEEEEAEEEDEDGVIFSFQSDRTDA